MCLKPQNKEKRMSDRDKIKLSDEALVAAHKSGDSQAFEKLFRRYNPLLKKLAGSASSPLLPYEDLLQEGMLGLFSAVQNFDEDKGVPFSAFAKLLVERRVCDALKHENRGKNRILSDAVSLQNMREIDEHYEAVLLETDEDLLQKLISRENDRAIQKSLETLLSKQEYLVLSLRMKSYAYEQIAEQCQLTVKQVDNSLQRAKRKLKAADFLV